MIRLETAHIEEMRGIRKLDLDFRKENFAISGPNGSGKSGVVDAIEFGLTGDINRLTGRGTKGLSVTEHGPHVDKTKSPDAAFVELRVFIPALGKSARITRKVSVPNKPNIDPADDDVKAALAEVTAHPEIMLSRREILRFILVEPRKRSEEIQALLKLEEIGQIRAALCSAHNKLQQAQRMAAAQTESDRSALQRHLQIATLRPADLLDVVNERRKVLGVSVLTELSADTKIDNGLTGTEKPGEFNKDSALRDLKALAHEAKNSAALGEEEAAAMVEDLGKLEADPALFQALQQRVFIERGLALVNGPGCPLCDAVWDDEQNLIAHLKAKLAKSEEARKLQSSLLKDALTIAEHAARIIGLIASVHKLAAAEGENTFAALLSDWRTDLESFRAKLNIVDGLTGLKQRLSDDWLEMPRALDTSLQSLTKKVNAKPNQTAALDSQTFLTTAQVRLGDYRESLRKNKAAEIASASAQEAYETYCTVMEDELDTLYDEVQKDFSTYYRAINGKDESSFMAKLTSDEGSLALDVNFYDRGLFPPAAYHSEGHQDGMGLCLYLALMKRLFGDRFTFALLDDVVMSVDTGHRYEFCKLLKSHFPKTQFILTTHDRLWAEQMKSAGLVTAKTSKAFYGWTIDDGPLVESNHEIWTEISAALAKGKVDTAAAALRHHLEYVSRHLADELGASPQFRSDGNYELGELMPSVLKRMKELHGKAAEAAQSWSNVEAKQAVAARKAVLSTCNAAKSVEEWAVNKAVHYNEWTNFGKKDFEPVLAAFKELLSCFSCNKCGGWLYVMPSRGTPESLRCPCNAVNVNLKGKAKGASGGAGSIL